MKPSEAFEGKNSSLRKTFDEATSVCATEKSESEEWGAWKFVSEMLDTPIENGIYPTSKCYEQIHDFVVEQKEKALTSERERCASIVEEITTKLQEYFGVCEEYEEGCVGCEVMKIIKEFNELNK